MGNAKEQEQKEGGRAMKHEKDVRLNNQLLGSGMSLYKRGI